MKAAEFKMIVNLAVGATDLPGYFTLDGIDGMAIDGKRRFLTVETVAAWVRGEVLTFGGTIDQEALEQCRLVSKRIDLVGAK